MLKVWGYGKTPSRSCCHMQVYMDDSLIADVDIRCPPSKEQKLIPQSILFCADPTLQQQQQNFIYRDVAEQDVLLVNDRQCLSSHLPGHADRAGMTKPTLQE